MSHVYYYEAHITLPPSVIVNESAVKLAAEAGFHHSIIDGDGDVKASVLTSRDKTFETLRDRMIGLMQKIKCSRYKVEAIMTDSKIEDLWGMGIEG